ncbi:MAG: hypothetical protein O3C27_08270 [Actinomycetota bacterium]|nr:hypothetical protein [Actinomycetota bacterium]
MAAVPGSVLSAASAGSNSLLVDGCVPVRHAQDILDLIGHAVPAPTAAADPMVEGSLERRILVQLRVGEQHLDQLVVETGFPPTAVVQSVAVLIDRGLARRVGNRVSVSDS